MNIHHHFYFQDTYIIWRKSWLFKSQILEFDFWLVDDMIICKH